MQNSFNRQKTRECSQHCRNTTHLHSAKDKTARSTRQQYNAVSVCRRQDSAISTATIQHSVSLQKTRHHNQLWKNATLNHSAESKTVQSTRQQCNIASFCRGQDSAINTATMQHSVILQKARQRNQHGNSTTQLIRQKTVQ